MQDLKKGDVVHVRGVVQDTHATYPAVQFNGVGFNVDIDADDIVHVEPRGLQVGDIVKDPDVRGGNIRVNAVLGDYAWICGEHTLPGSAPGRVYPLVSLIRAESPKPRTRRDQLAEAYPHLIARIEEAVKEQCRTFRLDEPAESCAGQALNKVFTWGETTEGYYFWAAQARAYGWNH